MRKSQKTALVVCYSRLVSDPRVVRQIGWLVADGWTVDTVGFGPKPSPTVRDHTQLGTGHRFARLAAIRLAIHTLLPRRTAFRLLEESRFPARLRDPAALTDYDLLFVNDIDLLPWAARMATSLPASERPRRIHLDLHEYHKWEDSRGLPAPVQRVLGRYHEWLLDFVSSPVFTSRSTVAGGIADLYAERYGVPRPAIVRNAPAFIEQRPSAVADGQINLIYHGNADLARGLALLVQAMDELEERFVLNFMLTGPVEGREALHSMAMHLGERVQFVDPVPMAEVAAAVNRFDLEVIFFPPTGPNYLYSLPNKLFEAVQGRLGVVIGRSPSMAEVIEEFGNGIVVEGWEAADLSRALNTLTAEHIREMKAASNHCARELNSDRESQRFTAALGQPERQ